LQYLDKFKQFNIEASKEEVFSSSYVAAAYLKSLDFKGKVYIVGENGISKELEEAGIEWIGAEQDKQNLTMGELSKLTLDPNVGAVVVLII